MNIKILEKATFETIYIHHYFNYKSYNDLFMDVWDLILGRIIIRLYKWNHFEFYFESPEFACYYYPDYGLYFDYGRKYSDLVLQFLENNLDIIEKYKL